MAEQKIRQVLDHGFVVLEDFMGGDAAVIRAARICYESKSSSPAADTRLINSLMKSEPKHNTPFEHAVFRFYVKCPIFVSRQWLRHRIGTFNERSLRRVTAELDFYMPDEYDIFSKEMYRKGIEHCFQLYQNLLKIGWRKEVARAVLPLTLYTEFIWTVNAWSLMNWLKKRLDGAAQWEHRQYAKAILEIFEDIMPITAAAFEEHVLYV